MNFDPLTYAIGALEAAEAVTGHMVGGRCQDADQTAEAAWETVVSTRATTVSGLVWKVGRVWCSYIDEPVAGAAEALADICRRAILGENVAKALTDLAERLGSGCYADLIRSAAADAEGLAQRELRAAG